jgi:hypothetical protein
MVDHLHQPARRRNEVGIEDGHELAFGHFEPRIQSAGLEAMTVGAMNVNDRVAQRGVAVDDTGRHGHGFVGRVVQHLDLELLARILDRALKMGS